MRNILRSVSLSLLLFLSPTLRAQQRVYPDSVGSKVRYEAAIEMRRGSVSGVCVLANDGGVVRGCLFNEFGLSVLDFTYFPERGKVKLHDVVALLDKWYIKRVLKRDLARLMANLRQGDGTYCNERLKINYHFTLLQDAVEE